MTKQPTEYVILKVSLELKAPLAKLTDFAIKQEQEHEPYRYMESYDDRMQ